MSVTESLKGNIKWKDPHPEQMSQEKLIHWIIDGLKSYETLESARFRDLLNSLNNRFVVPCEKQIRTMLIPSLARKVQFNTKREIELHSLSEGGHIYLTTDILWSSPSRDFFISFTAHWISANVERKLVVLRCMRTFSR